MKFRFKYLVAGTLACLTTVSPTVEIPAWGWQDDSTSLQSLLGSGSKPATGPTNSLLPRPITTQPIQQVGFLTPVQDGGVRSTSTTTPLAPRSVPTGPTPAPLVPVRSSADGATALPAPIVSVPISRNSLVPAETGRPATAGGAAPIVSAPIGGQTPSGVPIITSPLAPNISRSTLPSGPVPVSSAPAAPAVVDTQTTRQPTIPVIPAGQSPRTVATAPATQAGMAPSPTMPPSSLVPTPTLARTGEAAESISVPPTTSTATTPPSVGTAVPTGPNAVSSQASAARSPLTAPSQPIAAASTTPRSMPNSDAIEVTEISAESMADLIQAFGLGSPQAPAATSMTQESKKRVAAIGTGSMITENPMPIQEMDGSPIGSSLVAEVEGTVSSRRLRETYGLNLGHERPLMPAQLPYDGYGTISGASKYALLDFLYMQRDGGDFSVSYAPQLEGYQFSPGVRFTFGNRWDSIEGYEIGATLLETQTSHTSVASPTNSLFAWLQPRNGFDGSNLSSFNNASFHHSFHKGHYYAADFNRVNWNWDVMSTFIGLRYTGIDEMYALHTVGGGGDLGAYRLRARNHMVGPQVGGSLHYDIGRKLSFSLSAKIAGYANFYQTDTEFANNNLRLLDVQDSRADLAWGTELACFTHLRLTPRARIKGGWELWFYDRVASSRDQLDGFVSPFSGAVAQNGDEALFYGFSLGLEWFR